MEVEIYLDSLFFLNLVINLWILELLQYKFTMKIRFWRRFSAAAVGSGIYIILFFIPKSSVLISILGGFVSIFCMTAIILPRRKSRYFFALSGMGLLYSFIISGILRAVFVKWKLLQGGDITVGMVLLGAFLCLKIGKWCIQKSKRKKNQNIYKVLIKSGEQTITLNALLDTGNSLVEPLSKKPVCLIEEAYLARITLENPLFLRAIPYSSVGCEKGMLYGAELPYLECITEDGIYEAAQVICAGIGHKLSAKGVYQMILHPMILAEENRRSEGKE